MSGEHGRRTSSEVAHEAEDTRASLASTLEQLRTNLQPENVVDEVVSNARIGAASVADNLVGVAKQYPIPAVLIAAGSAMIMRFFSKGDRPEATGYEALGGGESRVSRASAPATSLRPPMLRNPSSFTETPGREAGRSASTGGGLLSDLQRRAQGASQAASDSISSQAGDAMQSVSRYMPRDSGEAKSKLANLFEEQPLILGAIGLAIGAAIGAALPITRTEDELMGSTAHRFRDSASDAARQEVGDMRAAAGEAVDNVRHAAADSIKTVVNKAGESFSPGSQDV